MVRKKMSVKKFDLRLLISTILKLIILLTCIYSAVNLKWTVFFYSIFVLILTFVPAIIKKNFKVNIPSELEFLFISFIYMSLFLGEIKFYFLKFWWWDLLLHTFSGIALGFIGLILIYIVYSQNKIKSNYIFLAVFAFCFALSIGAIWEIFEFGMDQMFGFNMQKSGLVDTMSDLIVDSIGALLTSIYAYFYFKFNHKNKIGELTESFVNENKKLYRQ
jgi:uncharacterized membrane protein YjdF